MSTDSPIDIYTPDEPGEENLGKVEINGVVVDPSDVVLLADQLRAAAAHAMTADAFVTDESQSHEWLVTFTKTVTASTAEEAYERADDGKGGGNWEAKQLDAEAPIVGRELDYPEDSPTLTVILDWTEEVVKRTAVRVIVADVLDYANTEADPEDVKGEDEVDGDMVMEYLESECSITEWLANTDTDGDFNDIGERSLHNVELA